MPFTLTDNEFFAGLTNLALFLRLYATNTSKEPLDFVDSFMSDRLAYGNTKIFPFSDLPEVADYSETSSLLAVTKVKTNEETIKITEKKVIKSSYSEYILEMAVTSAEGMNEFIGYILGQMESAKTDHLYNVIISDLYGRSLAGSKQNKTVNLLNVSGATAAADINAAEIINQKRIALAVQNEVDNISVFNTGYNELGYKQALDVSDMRFVIANPYKNEQVVNLFASLLKSEVIENAFSKPEMRYIPEVKVPSGQEKVIGWLMHKAYYQIFYKFVFMGSFFDASNLVINNFLHFWYGKGFLKNLPAVKFTAEIAGAAAAKA